MHGNVLSSPHEEGFIAKLQTSLKAKHNYYATHDIEESSDDVIEAPAKKAKFEHSFQGKWKTGDGMKC